MKPDWDKLMADYADHPSILIADVDCTTEGKALCTAHGVKGYPTIKYGDPNALEDYKGGRSLSDMQKFASESLGPSCGPGNLDLCDDDSKAALEALMALSEEEIESKVAEGTKKMEDAEATFKAEVEKLQATYQKLMADKEATVEEVNNSGLGMLKKVRAYRVSNPVEEKDEL